MQGSLLPFLANVLYQGNLSSARSTKSAISLLTCNHVPSTVGESYLSMSTIKSVIYP